MQSPHLPHRGPGAQYSDSLVAKQSRGNVNADESYVAKGVARSESTQTVKAFAREPPGAAA